MNTLKGLINTQCILSENRKTVDHFCIKCLLCCFVQPTLVLIMTKNVSIVVLELADNYLGFCQGGHDVSRAFCCVHAGLQGT